jgi:hypothetical protein
MSPDYFDTRFKLDLPLTELPESFAIITAYATTGETWTAEENQVASERLRTELAGGGHIRPLRLDLRCPFFRAILLRGISWAAGESPYRFDPLILRGISLKE